MQNLSILVNTSKLTFGSLGLVLVAQLILVVVETVLRVY